jgi:NAD(P)-dependent dehydrogenase (short-subunit alcohol dehydrogenase family)
MFGRIRLDDLNRQARKSSMFPAYADSKLSIMLFVHELARRGVRAYLADPGGADTAITRDSTGLWDWWLKLNALPFLAQEPRLAARSTIEAVTTDEPSGTYIAPRILKLVGAPKVTRTPKKVRDPVMAGRLWKIAAELTRCDWTVHPTARTAH